MIALIRNVAVLLHNICHLILDVLQGVELEPHPNGKPPVPTSSPPAPQATPRG